MVLDILIGVIIIFAMVFGYRAGFIWTFFHTLGWIVALVLAFLWTPRARDFLFLDTNLYLSVSETIGERLAEVANIQSITANLPRILRESVDRLAGHTTDAAGMLLSDILFTVISFIAVFFAVKLVFFLIVFLFSKKYSDGVSGVLDGLAGLLIGFIKGILLVFALLTAMIPVLSMFDTGLVDTVVGWLDSSQVAGTLYDNNFLALVLRDFLI